MITIIGILIAMLLPAVQSAREATRQAQCRNHLKQLSIGTINYHTAMEILPAGAYCKGTNIRHCHAWLESLLPYLEQQAMYDAIDFNVPNNVAPNPAALNNRTIPMLKCPSDPDAGLMDNARELEYTPGAGKSLAMSYMPCGGPYYRNLCFVPVMTPNINCIGCGGTWGSLGYNAGSMNNGSPGMFAGGYIAYRFSECTDGLTNTFLFGEQVPIYHSFAMYFVSHGNTGWTNLPPNRWKVTTCPRAYDFRSCTNEMAGFNSMHPGGVLMSMADGSVQFINEAVDYRVWNYLGNKADGQVVSDAY